MQNLHVEHFAEHGYAIVRGLFDAAEVEELATACDGLYAQALSHPASYRYRNLFMRLANDPVAGRIVRMVQWPSYSDPVFARYRVDRRLLEILQPLIGNDLKQIINQIHWKPPGARGVEFGYHQDIRSRRPRSAYRDPCRSYVQTGIAIDRHGRDNGAMTVLPGTHRLGELPASRSASVMSRALCDDDLRAWGIDPAGKVDLLLEPGDVALWHLHLVHGSGGNHSAMDRRFYLNGYVIADNCDRGEWAFRRGQPCPLGEPRLVHYEELFEHPEPHYVT